MADLNQEAITSAPWKRNSARIAPKPVGGRLKRVIDVVFAGGALIVFSPLILAVGTTLLLTDGRPVFFAHKRVGFRGRAFPCLKFRTMARDGDRILNEYFSKNPQAAEEWTASQKLRNDPRVSAFGAMLRRTSIDELPQLLNVLRGDMSCVGPRPITKEEMSRYGGAIDQYLRTRPGLTGLWQVQGRSDTTYDRRVELDSAYSKTWSFSRDIVILLKTLPVLLSRKGSC